MSTVISTIKSFFNAHHIAPIHLNLTKEHVGCTGYIDQMHPNDFVSGVHVGVDPHGRAYIALKTKKVWHDAEMQEYNDTDMVVAFQRYSDNPDFWVINNFNVADTLDNTLKAFQTLVVEQATNKTVLDDHGMQYHYELV